MPCPGGLAVEADDGHRLGGDGDDLVLLQLQRLAGVPDERRDVGPEEVLTVADAHHQGAVAPGAHDHPGVIGVHRQQRERALELLHHRAHRGGEVTVVRRVQQLRDDLGVGLAVEPDPLLLEPGLEGVEVLDDAVVDQCELAGGAPAVRMRVLVGRAAVGGPPGVSDRRSGRRQGLLRDQPGEVGELARLLADVDAGVRAITVDKRHARRVVPAVFEAPEALHDHVERSSVVGPADISDDSTHGFQPMPRTAAGPVEAFPRRAPACPAGGRPPGPPRTGKNGAVSRSAGVFTPYVELDRAAWSRLRDASP